MQTNYCTTMQNGKELIILLLLYLQISSVLAFSNYVPIDPSVCEGFQTSHGGTQNSTLARVWVELWDSSKQRMQSCFEHGASYKGILICAGDHQLVYLFLPLQLALKP